MNITKMIVAGVVLTSAIAAEATVRDDYRARRDSMRSVAMHSEVFDRNLSPEQRDALEFLYAYMPLPDVTDYSGDFFLRNVDRTLRTRKEMPWGEKVPDREFYHFVLPLRVNNEPLDDSRTVFYEELRDRVKNLSMTDAILEVNHWCHEKATYQPSDSRTHAPMMTVYTGIGRCGEESTFAVAALRAVGIPARQIYTPRWAHTDDNHAWVEAWADGKWHFIGACEPEPVLDLGWFNDPASRGMMMSTRVIGDYNGEEEILLKAPGYTDINVTENYAPVDTLRVTVTDASGRRVAGARTSYTLYNYAEFYPLVTKTADEKGRSSVVAGLGDLLVWGSDSDGNFGFRQATVGRDHEVTVVLDKNGKTTGSWAFDIIPPKAGASLPAVTDEQRSENDRRKALEDQMRKDREDALFMTPESAHALASELGLDADRLVSVMTDARANGGVLADFLRTTPQEKRGNALRLLELISMKDRSDVTKDILEDHAGSSDDEWVLNPRVANESLTKYRSALGKAYSKAEMDQFRKNPAQLVEDVDRRIEVVAPWQPNTVRMSPVEVHSTHQADAVSRNIYFVALARTMGIASRVDGVTGKPQWGERGEDGSMTWHDASFTSDVQPAAQPQGKLHLSYEPMEHITDARYYTHFTLSRIDGGVPQLLNYDEGGSWSTDFATPVSMDCGQYMLTTGQRLANGGVLASCELFEIKEGETTDVDLTIRRDTTAVQVIGALNSESVFFNNATGAESTILAATGRGYFILGMLTVGDEPSNHAIRDIASVAAELEATGMPMVILIEGSDDESAAKYLAALPKLPSNVILGRDIDSSIVKEVNREMETSAAPVFVIADTFNRIVFHSSGYTIGLGQTLLDTIKKL